MKAYVICEGVHSDWRLIGWCDDRKTADIICYEHNREHCDDYFNAWYVTEIESMTSAFDHDKYHFLYRYKFVASEASSFHLILEDQPTVDTQYQDYKPGNRASCGYEIKKPRGQYVVSIDVCENEPDEALARKVAQDLLAEAKAEIAEVT